MQTAAASGTGEASGAPRLTHPIHAASRSMGATSNDMRGVLAAVCVLLTACSADDRMEATDSGAGAGEAAADAGGSARDTGPGEGGALDGASPADGGVIVDSAADGPVVETCPDGSVTVAPSDDLKAMVAASAGGTTFCLQPGVHRDFDVLNTNPVKNGDTFIGLTGAIENGAKTLAPWTQVTINSVTYWTTAGGIPIIDRYNPYMNCSASRHVTLTCYYSQALYLDNTTYEHTYRLIDVTAGTWYYEFQGLQSASVVAGGSGYAVGDVLAVSGGTGCPSLDAGCGSVKVTSIGSAGAVTGIELRALGYGYPAGPVTETTTDTTGSGLGCTVSAQGGAGGVTNNIYLASSEDPNAHAVEIGANVDTTMAPQFLFHSNSAQDITIEGLTVEKYAGPLDFGPIDCNSEGSNGTAAGWLIQHNEVMLNMHDGILVGYGTEGVPTKVLNNVVHDNGQEGMGGGNPVSFITESGNDIYSNDTAWVPNSYGCGSIKHGGMSTGSGGFLDSYNTVHDEPNGCCGLWSDVSSGNGTYDHNTVLNISGEGIRIEISGTGPMRVTNNTVSGSGGGAIVLASSSNTTVQHNNVTASGAGPGIDINFDGRSCGTGCPSPPSGNVVSMNSITVPATTIGLAAGAEDYTSNTSWLIAGIFDSNTYCVPSSPWSASSWILGENGSSPFLNFTDWQTKGQDVHGTLTTASCPSAVQP
jgi:parallel beta-helix repeat protein